MKRACSDDELYFVTLTVVNWIDVFTRRVYKDILISNLQYCQLKKGLKIYSFVIMSNHLHLICSATEGKRLSDILRDFKTYTSKKLTDAIGANQEESRREWMISMFKKYGKENPSNKYYQFWQNGNYPVHLYSPSVIDQKVEYIHENPVKAGWVNEASEYLYSSASPLSPLQVFDL